LGNIGDEWGFRWKYSDAGFDIPLKLKRFETLKSAVAEAWAVMLDGWFRVIEGVYRKNED
jgi:hypothetical protein